MFSRLKAMSPKDSSILVLLGWSFNGFSTHYHTPHLIPRAIAGILNRSPIPKAQSICRLVNGGGLVNADESRCWVPQVWIFRPGIAQTIPSRARPERFN